MRDLLFGAIAAATSGTRAYSADSIDFGASNSRLADTNLKTGNQNEAAIVFSLAAALAAIDYVTPVIQDSADGSTWADIVVGPACAPAHAAGVCAVIPFPYKHRRYVRAGVLPTSSGTFTAVTVNAWVEPGVRE